MLWHGSSITVSVGSADVGLLHLWVSQSVDITGSVSGCFKDVSCFKCILRVFQECFMMVPEGLLLSSELPIKL